MRIKLSDHFTYKRLLRFVISPVLMMIFTSLYSIVDGFFVSNYVGKTPFAAVNLIMPVMMGIGTVGFMIGTGGSAIVSKTLGEGKRELAQRYFSMLVYTAIILGGAGCCFFVKNTGWEPLRRLLRRSPWQWPRLRSPSERRR